MPASVAFDPWTGRPSPDARLVLAVGSNAAPNVLSRKLATAPAGPGGPPLRFHRVRVMNVTVGYSAHVSARGYIPAAPIRARQQTLTSTATWLSEAQAVALDVTEPNYDRRTVNTHDHPLIPVRHPDAAPSTLLTDAPGPGLPAEADLYVSRHGVLVDPETGEALAFGTQAEVFDWLFHQLRAEILDGSAEQICARLAAGAHAAELTEGIHAAGLAASAWPGDRYATGDLDSTDGAR